MAGVDCPKECSTPWPFSSATFGTTTAPRAALSVEMHPITALSSGRIHPKLRLLEFIDGALTTLGWGMQNEIVAALPGARGARARTSGGAGVTPMYKRSGLSAGIAALARVGDTGLTATNGVAGAVVPLGAMGRVTQTTTNFQSIWSALAKETEVANALAIELAQNELLAIRQSVNSVIGDNIVGLVEAVEL